MSYRDEMERKVQRLEKENFRLKKENEKLKDTLRFLPPESFLLAYSLLTEVAYLSRYDPRSEIKVEYYNGTEKILIRDYRAYKVKRGIDRQLQRLRQKILGYLEHGTVTTSGDNWERNFRKPQIGDEQVFCKGGLTKNVKNA